MKRHSGLVPLSHDHHHGLVQSRRLRRAAEQKDAGKRADAARAFLRFFRAETVNHFREEEELLFPLVLAVDREAPDVLVQALVEHIRIHALVGGLAKELREGTVSSALLAELGEQLEGHIRLEERVLFPLIEACVSDEELSTLSILPREHGRPD